MSCPNLARCLLYIDSGVVLGYTLFIIEWVPWTRLGVALYEYFDRLEVWFHKWRLVSYENTGERNNCLVAHALRSLPSGDLHAISNIIEYQAYNRGCGYTFVRCDDSFQFLLFPRISVSCSSRIQLFISFTINCVSCFTIVWTFLSSGHLFLTLATVALTHILINSPMFSLLPAAILDKTEHAISQKVAHPKWLFTAEIRALIAPDSMTFALQNLQPYEVTQSTTRALL